MNIKEVVNKQFGALRNVFFFLLLPGSFIMLWVLYARVRYGIDTSIFTRDINATANLPIYTGIVSTIGFLLWCATGVINIFTGLNISGSSKLFLLHSGMLSLILMLDDILQFHEEVAPNLLHLPEWVVIILYGVIIGLILIRYRQNIFLSNYILLVIAILFFGTSISMDLYFFEILTEIKGKWIIEDGAKLMGVLTWFGYFVSIASNAICSEK